MVGLGNNLNELKRRIQKAHEELASLGDPSKPLDEMIGATNTLRLNEYLTKTDAKKTEIIAAYGEYAKQLEQIVSSLFSIQSELKELIKTEAALIQSDTSESKPKKTRSKKTSS